MHQHATEPEHFITGENQTLNVLADIARPIRLRLMFRANVGTFAALNEAFKSLCEHYAALPFFLARALLTTSTSQPQQRLYSPFIL
jgi:hypothetical protein